jgi:hypothetical protein
MLKLQEPLHMKTSSSYMRADRQEITVFMQRFVVNAQ